MRINSKKGSTWIVFLLFAFLFFWVGLNVIFPSFSYSINRTDIFKVSILKEEFGGKKFLSITPLFDYPYHKIDVEVDLNNSGLENQKQLPVLYGHQSEFYPPSSNKIETKEELEKYLFFENKSQKANGTLISGKDAVFFVSKGSARPFLGPEIFLRLGFDWDKVEQDHGGVLSDLEAGEKLNFTSPHPDGTFLRIPGGEIFLVWESELVGLEGQAKEIVGNEKSFIDIEKQEQKPVGHCLVTKSTSKKLVCHVEGVKNFQASGHTYLLELPVGDFQKVIDAEIEFTMLGNFNLNVARESLKRIKDSLAARYKGYIFN